jgi:hypothetical protein
VLRGRLPVVSELVVSVVVDAAAATGAEMSTIDTREEDALVKSGMFMFKPTEADGEREGGAKPVKLDVLLVAGIVLELDASALLFSELSEEPVAVEVADSRSAVIDAPMVDADDGAAVAAVADGDGSKPLEAAEEEDALAGKNALLAAAAAAIAAYAA